MGGGVLKVDFFSMGVIVRFEKARGWLAVRDLSRVLHVAISLRGTEMKRKPVSVCNETTCSQLWNPGISTRAGEHWNSRPCRYAHDILYEADAGGIPSESRKLG